MKKEFDESKHPRDGDGKFTDGRGEKYYRQNASYSEILRSDRETIKLPDEQFPRSLSAKWANYDIDMPDGTKAKFVEGTKLHHIEVFAGKGTKIKIRDVERLVRKYGGNPGDWQKVKGFGTVDIEGENEEMEIHWYQADRIGKVEFKVKIK